MYVPSHFQADDPDALIGRLLRRFAAVLVTVDADGTPIATHAPMLWDGDTKIATGHIARANPHWRSAAPRALIVLGGPQAYVSPSWYPTKAEHGKVVPTWNYETVHLSGRIEWFDDARRLEAVVRDLSVLHEAGRELPWSLDDAPRPHVDALLRGIVGFALHADRVEAKRKLSQNKSEADRLGVITGLAQTGESASVEVADLMRTPTE